MSTPSSRSSLTSPPYQSRDRNTSPLSNDRRESKSLNGIKRVSPSPGAGPALPEIHKSRKSANDDGRRLSSLKSRIPRPSKSGGFLLESSGDVLKPNAARGRISQDINSGKRRSNGGYLDSSRETSSTYTPREQKKSTPPSSFRRSGSGKAHSDNANFSTTPPRSQGSSRFERSTTSSRDSQDFPNRNSIDQYVRPPSARPPSIDTSQLVRLALNLNESRRMQLSPGQLASIGGLNERRVSLVESSSPPNNNRIVSVHSPPAHLDGSGTHHRHSSHGPKDGTTAIENQPFAHINFNIDQELQFSPATLVRAEKARTHLELFYEYRRLLQFLPALDQSNFKENSKNFYLGRVYNPLQYIRNKKVRARRRDPVDGVATGWDRLDTVRPWIEQVARDSRTRGFVVDGVASLPDWQSFRETVLGSESLRMHNITPKPNNPSTSKNSRVDWTMQPADLLADAYWVEDFDHKISIESHDGNKIFDQLNPLQRVPTRGSHHRRISSSTIESQSEDDAYGLASPETNSTYNSLSPDQKRLGHQDHSRPHTRESRAAKVRRHLLGRSRGLSNVSSDLSLSDQEETSIPVFGRKNGTEVTNTGPLERHMNRMIQAESRNQSTADISSPLSSHSESGARRLGVSEESHGPSDSPIMVVARDRRPSTNITDSPPKTTRISIENYDSRPALDANGHLKPSVSRPATAKDHEKPKTSHGKRPSFSFRHWQKPKHSSQTETTDFALSLPSLKVDGESENALNGTARSSLDIQDKSDLSKQNTNLTATTATTSSSPRRSLDSEKGQPLSPTQTHTRFFKGGRIGEIVRSELPHNPHLFTRRHGSARASFSSLKSHTREESPEGDERRGSHASSKRSNPVSEQARLDDRGRSASSNDLKGQNYYIKNLPSFVPSNSRSGAGISDDDHISRQQKLRNQQRERSRIRNLAPLSVDTSDVSPTNSSLNLSRLNTRDGRDRNAARDASRINDKRQAERSESRSSAGVRSAGGRLNHVLLHSGSLDKIDFGPTGLSHADARRKWDQNIADHTREPPKALVTGQDVLYVRSLLFAAGIKAKALVDKPDEIRDPPSKFLVDAAQVAGNTSIIKTPRLLREEHVLAAQLLSSHLSSTMTSFQQTSTSFRTSICVTLNAQIDDLRDRINTQLVPQTQTTVDEADAFVARLTTQHTLDIKRVNDAVDLMIRSRRRRLRWLRSQGFNMLEWFLVGLMWFIWLFVFLLRAVRGAVRVSIQFTRWMLWL